MSLSVLFVSQTLNFRPRALRRLSSVWNFLIDLNQFLVSIADEELEVFVCEAIFLITKVT